MLNIDEFFSQNINNFTFISNSEEETILFAKEFAKNLKGCEVITLDGELR